MAEQVVEAGTSRFLSSERAYLRGGQIGNLIVGGDQGRGFSMNAQRPDVPVRVRRVSAELRELRRRSGLSLEDVARSLDFSVSHLSRVENGIRKPQVDDVAALLGFYRVPRAKRAELLDLVRDGAKYNWLLEDDGSFRMLESFIQFERQAVAVKNYQLSVLPGLLQTPEYVRALVKGIDPDLAERDVETIIGYRMKRQQDCRGPGGPSIHVIVDENACRRPVGGRGVMVPQLHHMAQAARGRHFTLQVVPTAAGGHAGLEGAFQLLDLGRGSELLYTEDRGSVAFFEEEQHVAPARHAFRRLCEVACSPQDSLDLITSIADELARDRGEAGRGDGASRVAEEQPQLEVGMR